MSYQHLQVPAGGWKVGSVMEFSESRWARTARVRSEDSFLLSLFRGDR